jgi:hypothetical protein
MVEPYVLPIHFDNFQGKHEINSDSLIIFLEAYKEIAEIFGLSADIQIGVPDEGGWKTNLIFGITFIGFSPLVALLTGETADDWGKKGHVYVIERINEFITEQAKDVPNELPKECLKQKNKIFQQFQKDSCIDTFHLGNFSPIPRASFHLYIKELPDDEYMYLGETNITVHSPDWKGKRSWTGKIEIIEDTTASAFDFDKDLTGKFWEKVRLDTLPLHTTDVMRVQLIKRPTNRVKYLVIRVVSYNNEQIDSPISEEDIRKLATFDLQPAIGSSKSQQTDLFK